MRRGRMLNHSINHRIIGIKFENLTRIPKRIGIACGSEKAGAVKAALTGGLLTTLITDESAALRILS